MIKISQINLGLNENFNFVIFCGIWHAVHKKDCLIN